MARAKITTQWGDREARRRDILDAGLALLERKGYQGLTMRDVARGAGVTAGTVYTYFTNKEELFAALYAERLDALHGDLVALCDCATSPEDLFVAIADRYLAIYKLFGRELNVWALVVQSSGRRRAALPLVASAARILATVQAAVDRLTQHHGAIVPAAERHLAVPLLWATLQGLCDQYTGARHAMTAATWTELTRYAARTLVRGLAPHGED